MNGLFDNKNRSSIRQLIRYGFVGIITNVTSYLVYLLATYYGATPKISMSFLYALGATLGFLGNRKFTFAHKGNLLGSGLRYLLAHFIGYLINLALLIVMVDKFGYAHQWVQAIAIIIVAIFLFLAFKYFVFTQSDNISNTIPE